MEHNTAAEEKRREEKKTRMKKASPPSDSDLKPGEGAQVGAVFDADIRGAAAGRPVRVLGSLGHC